MGDSVIEECIFRYLPKECTPPEWSWLLSEIVEGYLSVFVAVIGLFGNVMSLLVLTEPGFQDVFNKLLIALSCFDMMFLGKIIVFHRSNDMKKTSLLWFISVLLWNDD